MNDRHGHNNRPDRRTRDFAWSSVLPLTADPSHGSSNLAFAPRAGNISCDTRAGIAG
jgi:hypothetical protein